MPSRSSCKARPRRICRRSGKRRPARRPTEAFDRFVNRYEPKYPKATEKLEKDREGLPISFDCPAEHWRVLGAPAHHQSDRVHLRHCAPSSQSDQEPRPASDLSGPGLQDEWGGRQDPATQPHPGEGRAPARWDAVPRGDPGAFVICNNARYYHSGAIGEYLKTSRIKLVFLAPTTLRAQPQPH